MLDALRKEVSDRNNTVLGRERELTTIVNERNQLLKRNEGLVRVLRESEV
jgi:hypothetical protein